jgi:hypothetical protein
VTILKTPLNLSYTTDTTPAFSWAAASGALGYRIQVDESDLFDSMEINEVRPVSTSYTPITALPYGKYYWRMQVNKAAGWGDWTPAFRFTVTPPLPIAPVITAPANGYTTASVPALTWNAVPATPVGIKEYEYQISKSYTFKILEQTGTVVGLSYTPSGLLTGRHYWRVRAINNLDVPGAWASYRSFTLIP